jgi:asparagine synthetase B (glutamine-hydrolysing)
MCGIFGGFSQQNGASVNYGSIQNLIKHSKERGRDSSGFVNIDSSSYAIYKADYSIDKLFKYVNKVETSFVFGHSRLITNGLSDNQPVTSDNVVLIHNGIVVNGDALWPSLKYQKQKTIDSEVLLAIAEDFIEDGKSVQDIADFILNSVKGTVSMAMLLPNLGKLLLLSNCGSLYYGQDASNTTYFASEKFPLLDTKITNIKNINKDYVVFDIASLPSSVKLNAHERTQNLIPEFVFNNDEEGLLEYNENPDLKRCTKCLLPHTMPFIRFDEEGVCNYCNNYKLRNKPKPIENLHELLEPYRRPGKEEDCLVPFSGGRDSCMGLHLIIEELGMKPITYTYDWGMVTDLGRRNISRMCSQLGVENIIIAADIEKKRDNIKKNIKAWMKSPHLGMISLFTAGDKHFFRYIERVKEQTGINVNLWGVNPLEVTHFKAGFLGMKPAFEEEKVYYNGIGKQLRYHSLRFRAMTKSMGYFNSSLWDTLSGEYYRSFMQKNDYYHIFDFRRWDEEEVDNVLLNTYDWEKAIDTPTTWRIGDGTAAFYNYIYYTVAGFSEHDTFRSNQIREGDITREEALKKVKEENRPRYQNLRWYLDSVGLDFKEVINVVNNIPKLY